MLLSKREKDVKLFLSKNNPHLSSIGWSGILHNCKKLFLLQKKSPIVHHHSISFHSDLKKKSDEKCILWKFEKKIREINVCVIVSQKKMERNRVNVIHSDKNN